MNTPAHPTPPAPPAPPLTRLQAEQQRLFGVPPPTADASVQAAAGDSTNAPVGLVDRAGAVRALVLAVARPADWAAVHRVWVGVQRDLGLPAPAIAVSGTDAYQLWFSTQQAMPAVQAQAFLQALQARYLGELPAHRLHRWPLVAGGPAPSIQHTELVPAVQVGLAQWSSFVAADLAPMFADEPWLDGPPNPDGQASLLARLSSITLAEWAQAQAQLMPLAEPVAVVPSTPPAPALAPAPLAPAAPAAPAAPSDVGTLARPLDPRQFLHSVMGDAAVPLALRIEAARALLQAPGG